MTATTANRGYVYPIAADRPCDTSLIVSRTVLTQFEPDLIFLDSEYKRFTRYPFAFVEYNGGNQVLTNAATTIAWDTVVEDTWGFVDLGKDAKSIYPPKDVPGRYIHGSYAVCSVAPAGLTAPWVQIAPNGTVIDVVPIGSTATVLHLGGWRTTRNTAANTPIGPLYLSLGWGGGLPATLTVTYAAMWAYWVRDF